MPSIRQRTALRKYNLRNGALLAVSEATKLVNIPLARDVARHIRQVAIVLKPSILQAPKTNDSNARDLAKHVEGLLHVLNRAVQYLEDSGLAEAGLPIVLKDLSSTDYFITFSHLSDTYTQLQELQTSTYTTKLASQTEFRERILQLKEQLSRTIVDLTLRLLVIVLDSGAQNQLVMVRRLDFATREHNTLARNHNALVRITQRRQRISDRQIRSLKQECKGLTRQVNAVLLMRQTDEQRITYLI
ncbi:hypothetical protein OPQ81_000129 [Rhizoctonia solani]|nr:hypothetical protein OPQ81_000129 [Rhizoctonia solani]